MLMNKWVLSVILPGLKPQILGGSLSAAIEEKFIPYNDRDYLFDGLDEATHSADRTISIWAHRKKIGRQILHGRELVDLWEALADDIWITLLGNPLWRALDCFRNIQSNLAHPLHEAIAQEGYSFASFYASPISASVCNRQCRKLAMVGGKASPELLLKKASQTLDRFAWVGLEGVDAGPQNRLAHLLKENGYECEVPVLPKMSLPRGLPDAATEAIIRKAEAADFALWDREKAKRTSQVASFEY